MKWWILWLVLRIHLEPFNCSVNLIASLLSHSLSLSLYLSLKYAHSCNQQQQQQLVKHNTYSMQRTNLVYHFSSILPFSGIHFPLPHLSHRKLLFYWRRKLRSWFVVIGISAAIPQPWERESERAWKYLQWNDEMAQFYLKQFTIRKGLHSERPECAAHSRSVDNSISSLNHCSDDVYNAIPFDDPEYTQRR